MDIRVADLRVTDQFQIPQKLGIQHGGMKCTVIEIGPSRMYEGQTRISVQGRRGHSVEVLPDDLIVTLLERDGKPLGKCRCTNHMGTRKVAFISQENAAAAILRKHLTHGQHRIYPCPTEEGRFHITSKKARVHRPEG